MNLTETSVRGKLTIMALVVMATLYLALGALVQAAGRSQILANVDLQLQQRAEDIITAEKQAVRFMEPPPPGGGYPLGGGPGRPSGSRQGPGAGLDSRGNLPRQGGGPGDRGNPMRGGGGPGDDGGPMPDGGPDDQGNPMRGGPGPDQGRGGPNMGQPMGGGGPGPRIDALRLALRDIGNHLLSIGPRFIPLDPGPPIAPPDMMEPYDTNAIKLVMGRGVVYSNVTVDGEKVRIITQLARDPDGRKWVAQVPYPLSDIDHAIATLNQTLLLLLPFALVLTGAASLFLIDRVMKPIRSISRTADSISGEDLSGRLKISGSDEFARLGDTINGMLGRLEGAFVVQRKTLQRLEAVLRQQRRFTADASHELKTPLAVIKANAGVLLHDKRLPENVRMPVEAVDEAASRMNRLVQDLMLLARADSGESMGKPAAFDLRLAVQNAIDQVQRPMTKKITYADDGSAWLVKGVERDIERVFVNLIDNACRHTEDNGHIDVHVARVEKQAVVTVTDDGEGIELEHLIHIFDRFYRVELRPLERNRRRRTWARHLQGPYRGRRRPHLDRKPTRGRHDRDREVADPRRDGEQPRRLMSDPCPGSWERRCPRINRRPSSRVAGACFHLHSASADWRLAPGPETH